MAILAKKINIIGTNLVLFLAIILVFANLARARNFTYREENNKDYKDNKSNTEFFTFAKNLASEAKNQGVSQKTTDDFLYHLKFIDRAIKLDQTQPDKTHKFSDYLKNVLPESRIKKAKNLYQENKILLNKIGKEYGVNPNFIVALWGIESDFGNNMGHFNVINSLATLAYEGRRADFFKSELIEALKIVDQGNINIEEMQGSWAGAMGQIQFMPSSFAKYAVDYDGDSKKDIWHNKSDAFASIANYLANYGWDDKSSCGYKVRIPANYDKSLIDRNVEKTLLFWQESGISFATAGGKHNVTNAKFSLVQPDSSNNLNVGYLVSTNYKVILQWNRSLYFATAVCMLSDRIYK